MQRLETRLDGPVLVGPAVHGDARGFFCETYRKSALAEVGVHDEFVQDNHSRSGRGVL
ncbi:MAG: dTDP-4-dehydrorhamnose 3,5-epimerase family protein, partial [Thermoleophilaceae bacterium]